VRTCASRARPASRIGIHAPAARAGRVAPDVGTGGVVRTFGVVVARSVTANHVAVGRGGSVGVGAVDVYGRGVVVAVGRSVGVGSVVGSHVEPDAQSAVAIAAVPEAATVDQ